MVGVWDEVDNYFFCILRIVFCAVNLIWIGLVSHPDLVIISFLFCSSLFYLGFYKVLIVGKSLSISAIVVVRC